MSDNNIYTTEVVTTVRFTIRHFGQLTKEQMLTDVIPNLLDFNHMVGGEDMPTVESIAVVDDVIENANTFLEEVEA